MEFNIEFLQFSMPRASIYRLRVQMGNCYDKYGRCPEDEPEPSGRTTVQQNL
jgi:hypothetical protein